MINFHSAPTWVYQLRCSHDALLYVGIAVNLEARLEQHRRTKDWWEQVTFVDARQYQSRLRARIVESYHIIYDNPKYNIAGRKDVPALKEDHIGRRGYTVQPAGLVLEYDAPRRGCA